MLIIPVGLVWALFLVCIAVLLGTFEVLPGKAWDFSQGPVGGRRVEGIGSAA
jgi:hypothetical protein